MVVFQLLSCHEHKEHEKEGLVGNSSQDSLKIISPKKAVQVDHDTACEDSLEAIASKSVTHVPYESVFLKKRLIDCKLIHSQKQKEDDSFLNAFIAFYEVRSLPERRLINADYCKFILKKTPSQLIEESNFIPGNFKFSHFYTNIDEYGKCYIGKYYFPSAINSAQRRAVIVLQMDLKEISILNFDDVKFIDGKLICDFNVRGKHFIYKLKYSKECKRFINYKEPF